MATALQKEIRERLRWDTPYWTKTCAKIVDRRRHHVPLVMNNGQEKLHSALTAQRERGEPMRAITCKARKLGFSTWVQAIMLQRCTQHENQAALVVAQDTSTATELFGIGETMYANLPEGLDPPYNDLKPPIRNKREGRLLWFGEKSRTRRQQGFVGVNSYIKTDTAKEVEAGRGFTYSMLHLSEYAFWENVLKGTALLNAVPDEPETVVVIESTANGMNHFKDRWDAAEEGKSSYTPVFAAWHEEPAYAVKFHTDEEREDFEQQIGSGTFGEDEDRLIEEFGCTPEQLAWRRKIIVDQCESDLRIWNQEFPASPHDAFVSTGKQVFNPLLVTRVIDHTKRTDPQLPSVEHPGPELGILKAGGSARRQLRSGVIDVPTDPEWVPQEATGFSAHHPFWRVWEPPELGDDDTAKGSYMIAVDPSSGEETEKGDTAWHAIQVINHRTRMQCAEYRSRIDPDLVGIEAYLAALYYNHAWLSIETTGGYGTAMAKRIWRDYRYSKVYFRKNIEKTREKQEDRLGWDTNRVSKVFIEDGLKEILRTGVTGGEPHMAGIRSRLLVMEMATYVKDDRGRTGPDDNKFSDLLMAYMIAQAVAQEKPILPDRPRGAISTTRPIPRFASTGY